MDYEKALSILKIDFYVEFEDVELQYESQRSWTQKSFDNASNESVKKRYGQKLEDLKLAYDFLKSNKNSSNRTLKTPKIVVPKFKLKPFHKVMLFCGFIIILGFGIYYGIKSYQAEQDRNKAEQLLEEGLMIFNSAKINQDHSLFQKSIDEFKKAEELGSIDGRYYHGLALFKIGQKPDGFIMMQKAVNDGFNDSIELRFFRTLQTGLKDQ